MVDKELLEIRLRAASMAASYAKDLVLGIAVAMIEKNQEITISYLHDILEGFFDKFCGLMNVSRVEFTEVEPEKKLTEKELTDAQRKLFFAMKDFCEGDQEKMKELLKKLTTFTGKDGKTHTGKDSFYGLSDKMAGVTLSKLERLKEGN